MSKAELGAIISKTFAIFYLFKSVQSLTTNTLPALFLQGEQTQPYITVWLLSNQVILLIFVLIFGFGADKIGKLIAGNDEVKAIALFSPEQFMTGVFVAFGCILLGHTIPDISELTAIALSDETTQRIKMNTLNLTEKIVSIGLYSALALAFILGANGLQKTVFALRNFGSENR